MFCAPGDLGNAMVPLKIGGIIVESKPTGAILLPPVTVGLDRML